jgi:2-oxoisovalerate dehydrogenase E1 component
VVSQALERAALAGEDDIRALIREMQADSALSVGQQEQAHAARA